jgi:hypothetical protein
LDPNSTGVPGSGSVSSSVELSLWIQEGKNHPQKYLGIACSLGSADKRRVDTAVEVGQLGSRDHRGGAQQAAGPPTLHSLSRGQADGGVRRPTASAGARLPGGLATRLQANALLLASGIEFSPASGIACQGQLIQGVSLNTQLFMSASRFIGLKSNKPKIRQIKNLTDNIV